MLESNSYTQPRYYFNCSMPHSINVLMKRGFEECVFLILPEDTSENTDHRHKNSVNTPANKIRSTVKVGFWVAISIAISLVAGRS